jgi:hypothetical protein
MQFRLILMVSLFSLMSSMSYATSSVTTRIPQFSNDKVSAWETIIYPGKTQILKMHRHERDRIVVAFNNGLLKITNDQGKSHYLKLEKNKAYFLKKDSRNERHIDQNLSSHVIKVLVIELS